MSTAAKLHKAVTGDATVVDAKTALLMATRNGAEIVGLGDVTGSIAAGKKADIVIANLSKPHLTPVYDIYSHITYCMRPDDVETVLVNGKVVVENGSAVTIDEKDVLKKARIWQEKISQSRS